MKKLGRSLIVGMLTGILMIFSAAYNYNAFAGDAVLTWDPNIGPDLAGYKIYYGTTSGGPYNGTSSVAGMNSPVDIGNLISSTVTGLGARTYYFAVTAYDSSNNESGFSNEVSKTIPAPTPSTPVPTLDTISPVMSSITASNIAGTSAVITWSTNEAADSQVQYGTTTAYGFSTTLSTNPVTSHSVTLSGLSVPITYHFRVLSRDAAGNLATSGDNTFTTTAAPDTTPPVISGVTASNITGSGAVITWSTDEAADSQIQYGATMAYESSTTLDSTLVTSHTQPLSGLVPNTTYHYRVKSADASNNPSTSGDNVFVTASSQIQEKSLSAAMSGGCGMVRPSDGKPSGPGQAADMPAVLTLILIVLIRREILRVTARARVTTASMHLFLIGILILSVSGCGTGSSGSSPAITTESSIGTGPGKAVLNWDKPTTHSDGSALTDLTGFKLYYGTTFPLTLYNGQAIKVVGTTVYTLDGFDPGTYYFAVTAYDKNGNESPFSNEVSKVIAGTS